MRDRTRRTLCRLAFCMFCLFPLAGVGGWVLFQRTALYAAGQRSYWQNQFHTRIGVEARIGTVRWLHQRRVLLSDVLLSDPDSGDPLARIRLVEMAWVDRGLLVLLSQPEIEAGQFQNLWSLVHHHVLRAGKLPMDIQVSAAELTLHAGSEAMTFTDLCCTIDSTDTATSTLIDFRVAGTEMASPAQLQVVRRRTDDRPITGWQLRTGPTPLPCSLFSDYCRPLRRLGGQCRFQGTVWARESAEGWNGEILGQFDDVALQSLIDPFPFTLRGDAQITFNQAAFHGGRLRSLTGSLSVHEGVVSRSLVSEFAESLQLRVATGLQESDEPLHAFQRLAISFRLEPSGLRVSGLCDPSGAGALMVGPAGPMVWESQNTVVPVAALARALAPDSRLQVPATEETRLLIHAMPLPRVQPTSPRTADKAHVPLRWRE